MGGGTEPTAASQYEAEVSAAVKKNSPKVVTDSADQKEAKPATDDRQTLNVKDNNDVYGKAYSSLNKMADEQQASAGSEEQKPVQATEALALNTIAGMNNIPADQLGVSLATKNSTPSKSDIWTAIGNGLKNAGKSLLDPEVISKVPTLVDDLIKHPNSKKTLDDGVALLGTAGFKALQNVLNGNKGDDSGDQQESKDGFKDVSSWSELQAAATDSNIKGARLTQDITGGLGNLSVNHEFTIESKPSEVSAQDAQNENRHTINLLSDVIVPGLDKLTIKDVNLTGNNAKGLIQPAMGGTVTVDNVKASGSSLYNGNGNLVVKGNVETDFTDGQSISDDEFQKEMGTKNRQGVSKNWYAANIVANNVTVDKNATLTVNRQQNGHGIVLIGGNGQFGQGTLNVGENANLNITLKNGTATNEVNRDPENANTAVWAAHNGNFTTGTGANVTINAGHGRGIVFDEPFGGTTNHQVATPSSWYRNRFDVGQQSKGGNNNSVKLGDFTKLTMLSRDGILLGNGAKMDTGEHSTVSLNNYGNGVGLEGDAQANIVIGPHTYFNMQSDGKNHSGIWNAGNYIGLGENAQFTVDHDATFKFNLKNAWRSGSLNYADNFNIVSVKKGSNPTVNIENNAIFDGESDYRNIFGEILSFSYNAAPARSTVNINGAKYVNFQRHGATTPGGWQNVVSYDKQHKHSGNLFYSWPANTWNVNGNTYNVYKWHDETESQNGFKDNSKAEIDTNAYQNLVDSIKSLNAQSDDYWTGVKNLTLGVNMHRSNLQNISPNSAIGVKKGWNADDKSGYGFDTEFSQRLALVATKIPTEQDDVTDNDGDYDVIVKVNKELKPGQVVVAQEGKKGRTITVNRTYYTVDLSDPNNPKKIIDHSKGNDGKDTKVIKLGDAQDEIIYVGPETATINYVDKNGKAINGTDKKPIIGTVTASPVQTSDDGQVIFDAQGNVTAADVDYNESSDLQKAINAGYIKVPGQDKQADGTPINWEYALAQGTNKYNVKGLTKADIIKSVQNEAGSTATIAPEGPVYKVVLQKPEKQNVNVTVNYVDDDDNGNLITIGNKTYTDNLNGKPGDSLGYSTQPDITTIEGTGKYRMVKDEVPTDPKFPDKATTYKVHFVHVITPVGPNDPDPHGNDNLKKNDLQKTGTKQIHYVLDDGSTTDKSQMTPMVYYNPEITDITDKVTYNGTGYVDAVTGKLVNAKQDAQGNWVKDSDGDGKITWTPATNADKTYQGAKTKVANGYVADTASVIDQPVPTNDDGTPKDGTTEYVVYKQMGKLVPVDKKTGKTITGQPQPQYKNDPNDPTKALPTNPVNDIPGYKISNPQTDPNVDPTNKNVNTPKDPTKDTKVEYDQNVKDQNAALKLYDDTAHQWITITGVKSTTDANIVTASGKPSTDIDFISGHTDLLPQVMGLMNKGYAYVSTTKGADPVKTDGFVMLDPMTVENAVMTKDYSGINAAFGPYDTDDNTTQTFVVHVKHTYTPVNPDNPGDPKNPINPGDPDGPKYPDGTSKIDLIKNVHRTINYVVNGDSKAPAPINGDVTFTGSGYLDNVTGKWVSVDPKTAEISGPSDGLSWSYVTKEADGTKKEGAGKNYSFSSVAYKPVKGYYVSRITSKFGKDDAPDFSDGNGGVKKYDVDASKDLKDLTVTVVYDKIPEDKGMLSVVFHDDTTDTDITKANGKDIGFHTGDNDSRLVKAGTGFDYTPANDQKTLEDEGYVYVTTDGTFPTDHKVPKGETIVTIHMKHGVVPVGPDHPGTKGDPINPKNPNGPKYPDGVDKDSLTKEITRNVIYKVYDKSGKEVTSLEPNSVNQDVTYVGNGYFDKVTGAWVTATFDAKGNATITGYSDGLTWKAKDNNDKFAEIDAPSIDGYHVVSNETKAENSKFKDVTAQNVNSKTGEVLEVNGVTKDASNVQVTITLRENETTPTEATGKVTYIDDDATDPKNNVLKTDSLKGNVGDSIQYDPTKRITDYVNKGYTLVHNGVPTDGTFNSDPDKNNFEVHLKHDIEPIDPTNPTPKPGDPINPKDPDPNGPKYPNDPKNPVDANKLTQKVTRTIHYVVQDKYGNLTGKTVADSIDENVEFEGKGYIDKVTGKWVNKDGSALKDGQTPITWTVKGDSDSFAGHKSSSYAGYHLIGVRDVKDNKVGAKNTVDSDNDQDVKDVQASRDAAQPYDVYVVYEANGKVVPVDKDGNPIPDASTPKYGTDDNDPKKVTPTDTPEIPGYKISPDQDIPNRPKDTNPSGDVDPNTKKVTPTDPGKDTPVVYEKVEPAKDKGILDVIFRDQDEKNAIIQGVGQINGKEQDVGAKPSYTAENEKTDQDKLVNEGYVYVNTEGTIPDEIAKGTTTVTIYMKHGTQPVDPKNPGDPEKPNKPGEPQHPTDYKPSDLTETITRTIHYEGLPKDKAQADVPQQVTFEKKGVYDTVTGKWITPLTWTEKSKTVENVPSPTVDGYHVTNVDKDSKDKKNVDSKELTPTDKSYTVTVTYAKENNPTPEAKKGSITVKVYDQTTKKPLSDYGYTTKTVPEGTKVDYKNHDAQITDLKNHGYEIVDDPVAEGSIPKTVPDTDLTYTITVKHKIQPVTPDNQPKTPVDPNNPNGPKYPDTYKQTDLKKSVTRTIEYVDDNGKQVADPFTKTVNFTGTRFFDETNGKWTNVDGVEDKDQSKPTTLWTTDQTLQGQKSPVVPGYYLVGVKKNTEQHNDSKDGLNIDDVTVDHTASDYTVQVVYNPLKNIVPVDQNGNPIPGAKTPQYTNDPTDPTKPSKDETIPSVPGYYVDPNQPNPGVDPKNEVVNPIDPGKDTPVHYIKDQTPSVNDQTAVVNYVDADENYEQIVPSTNLTGKPGAKIDYSTVETIHSLENKGYVLAKDGFPAGATFDNDDKTTQTYTVILKHATKTVTPDKPGKPGQPIDPKNPDGPKYPDGTDLSNLKKTGTQTVHYEGAGNKTPKDKVQNFDFTKKITFDEVTGKTIEDSGWNVESHTFGTIDTPVVDGYHADKRTAGGTTITPTDLKKTVTVTYKPNGRIIPVDPNHDPIPDVPTPQYPTDPTDPTKVIPDEPVPTIPGKTPEVPTVTPKEPGKDTEVVYNVPTKDQTAIVNYIDQDNHNSVITTSGDLTGKSGTKIDYSTTATIKDLENKGYVLVKDGFPAGASFDNDDKTTQTYTVILKHGQQPVNPDNPGKPGQPINPNDSDSPKYPQGSNKVTTDVTRTIKYVDQDGNKVSEPVEQTAHFTGNGVIDKVTGQWITPITWTGDGNLKGEKTPVVPGYHVVRVSRDSNDNVNVDPTTVNHETTSYDVTVTYVKNGKIIPVDPDGNPIPNVPTPQYPTDPQDPAKVTPDEPVPTIPGYTPEKSTVTPQDPGTDTKVVYVPVAKKAQGKITYIDDTTGKTLTTDTIKGTVGEKITYTTADKIKGYENKGYVLVKNTFKDDNETFGDNNDFEVHFKHSTTTFTPQHPHTNGDDNGQTATKKTTTFTVHYIGAGNNNPADHVETLNWHRDVTVDAVTGDVISSTPWTTTDNYTNVNVPVVNGYHADRATVESPQADPDRSTEVTVTYAPNGHIIPVDQNHNPIPGADHPVYPTDPKDPTKVLDNEPVPEIPEYTPEQDTVTPVEPGTDTQVVYDQSATPNGNEGEGGNKVTPEQPATPAEPVAPAQPAVATPAPKTPTKMAVQQPAAKTQVKKLPQTGNEDSKAMVALGLSGIMLGFLGLGKKRRKNN